MNITSNYPEPAEDATLRQKDHYKIMAPLMEILREYHIKQDEFRKELSNVLGEEITMSKIKSWFRIGLKSGQLWTPGFGHIEVFDQVLKNILTQRGFVFAKGSRLYIQFAYPGEKTETEEVLIQQNRLLRLQIKDLEAQLKGKIANS